VSSALLGVLLLGEGVQKSAEHSNTRANAAKEGHGGLEDDARRDDDDNSLEGVRHGVGDGRQALEGQEGGLVVEVKGQAGVEGELNDISASAGLGDLIVHGDGILGVEEQHSRDGADQGEDVHHGVGVLGAEGLGPWLAHDALGDDVLEGGSLVRERRGNQGGPGEGQLLEGGKADTTDDGDQGSVDHGVVNVLQEDSVGGGGEDGLSGLDDLPKGDSSSAQSKDTEGVGQGSPQTHGEEFLPVVSGEVGLRAETGDPGGQHEKSTDKELSSREGPVSVGVAVSVLAEGDASLLVVDVVVNVAQIPDSQVKQKLGVLVPDSGNKTLGLGGLGSDDGDFRGLGLLQEGGDAVLRYLKGCRRVEVGQRGSRGGLCQAVANWALQGKGRGGQAGG